VCDFNSFDQCFRLLIIQYPHHLLHFHPILCLLGHEYNQASTSSVSLTPLSLSLSHTQQTQNTHTHTHTHTRGNKRHEEYGDVGRRAFCISSRGRTDHRGRPPANKAAWVAHATRRQLMESTIDSGLSPMPAVSLSDGIIN
jgi:hypothetical protein